MVRWRHIRVWETPWTPLFQGFEQPMYPARAWALRAWLRQVREARVWHREWLEEMYEWSEPLDDRELMAEVEAEEDEEKREQRIPQVQPASPPKALPPADTRRAALFAVFDEMEGHHGEFLQDGRPRVENVNDRLSTRSAEGGATRKEIDEVFTAWKQSRGSEAP